MPIFFKVVRDQYFDFQGRTRRRDYWSFFLTYVVLGLVVGAFGEYIGKEGQIVHGLFFLGMILPNLGAAVRRLHDQDRTGWWLAIVFVPVIGALVLFILMATGGTTGANRFGPDPKGRGTAPPEVSDAAVS